MTNHDPVQSVLDRLEGVKRTGDGQYMARCPAHDDAHASLSVGLGDDGRALVHCHRGCELADVLRKIGLTESDLFTTSSAGGAPSPPAMPRNPQLPAPPPEVSTVKKQIVASYDYKDATGNVLFQVVRYEPKDFRQRRLDGNHGWVWNLNGVPRVLYRLPELLAADPSAWVFIVEGEKDVDNVRGLGLEATCNPSGALKWSKLSDDSALHGRRVAIIPDKDKPGLAHGQDVASRLHGKAAVVKVIDLPDGEVDGHQIKDVSDWIQWLDGKTTEELMTALVGMAEAGTDWTPSTLTSTASRGEPDAAVVSAKDAKEKPAQAEALVRLALERYRLGLTDAGEPFAVERGGPNLARVFRGGREAFRSALARDYRRGFNRTANASALADALTTLEGECLDSTPEPVGLRLADYNGGIVLDLGDAKGQAVIVNPGGWEIVSQSPILFRRTALTGALPVPERGGDVVELRELLNLTDDTWLLVRGWLVGALLPSIPHPILLLGGEQGTGKSTAARMLVNLIDPSPAPLRSEPRDAEAWAIAAAGSWAVAVDNVSRIPSWWSDVLCRAVSGDGWVRRRLYTDTDLSVLAFRRVVVLTSIDAGAMRGDLGDRLLLADLNRIGEADRKTEADLDRHYAQIRPRVLGGLLDLLASVLSRLPMIDVPVLPRMADFGRVLAAVDNADEADDRALDVYLSQAGRIAGEVLESDLVALAVLGLLDKSGGRWEGTTGELLQSIRPAENPPRGWPQTAQALAGRVKRLTPAFRGVGVEIDRDRTGHDRARRLTVRRVGENIVRHVRTDAEGQIPGLSCGRSADDADDCGRSEPANRPPDGAISTDVPAAADDADDPMRCSSVEAL